MDESEICKPFIDDVPIKGQPTCYQNVDGSYQTIPSNPLIRKFVFEHLVDVNRILHRLGHAGATVSASKLQIAEPEVDIVGHRCTFEGRIADPSRVSKIANWPACCNVTEV